jgi:hypothetical protein
MKNILILLLFSFTATTFGQSKIQKIDLKNSAQWKVYKKLIPVWKDTIVLNKTEDEGMMVLQGFEMGNGIIEFDVKGQNLLQQSFVGIAFNIQNDKTFENIYFRPFNFMNPDTARRHRAVQYANLPDQTWFKLRETFPGKYESSVKPVPDPDSWFHARIVIEKPLIKVFVNDGKEPCLVIESLAAKTSGKIGLWTGPATLGSFTNLTVTKTDKK